MVIKSDLVRRLVTLAFILALAAGLGRLTRDVREYRRPCTAAAPVRLVNSVEFCNVCPSSAGVRGAVQTYSYDVGGVAFTLERRIEYQPFHLERLELFDPLYPSKVCYQPGNPSRAYLADAGATCGG